MKSPASVPSGRRTKTRTAWRRGTWVTVVTETISHPRGKAAWDHQQGARANSSTYVKGRNPDLHSRTVGSSSRLVTTARLLRGRTVCGGVNPSVEGCITMRDAGAPSHSILPPGARQHEVYLIDATFSEGPGGLQPKRGLLVAWVSWSSSRSGHLRIKPQEKASE